MSIKKDNQIQQELLKKESPFKSDEHNHLQDEDSHYSQVGQHEIHVKKQQIISKEQNMDFVSFYKENMSKWSIYNSNFGIRKEIGDFKNFFRNSLRKFSVKLGCIERKRNNFQRNLINPACLHLLIDLLIVINRHMPNLPSSYPNLPIFQLHHKLLHYCFETKEVDEEAFLELCSKIRSLRKLLKNLKNVRKSFLKPLFIQNIAQKIYNYEMNIQYVNMDRRKQERSVKEIKIIRIKLQEKANETNHKLKEEPEDRLLCKEHLVIPPELQNKEQNSLGISFNSIPKKQEPYIVNIKEAPQKIEQDQYVDIPYRHDSWDILMSDPYYIEYLWYSSLNTPVCSLEPFQLSGQ